MDQSELLFTNWLVNCGLTFWKPSGHYRGAFQVNGTWFYYNGLCERINVTVLLVAKDSQLLRKGFFCHTVYICVTLINERLYSIYSISMKVLLL